MIQISATQAVTELENLLSAVAQGEKVVIIGADGAAFQLLALPRRPKPIFGSARGLVHMDPEFDEPIKGFEDYVPRGFYRIAMPSCGLSQVMPS